MKKNKLNLLLHPFFIVSIILLLLNDISWKHEYHNWLTGKLSDFTGMFALPIFFYAVFSNNKKFIFICSGLFFICWKTELSEPILITVNYFLPVSISRVIDYSDLSALAMLLPAYHLREPNFSFSYRSHMIKLIAICSLFIFCHTSMIRSLYYPYRENEVRLNHDYTSRKTEMEIQQKLKQLGINYYLDSIRYYPVKDY